MSEADRVRWDGKYTGRVAGPPRLPDVFAPYADELPTSGEALDLACGFGAASVWLAERGLSVSGVDVSAVAIEQAHDLAVRHGVTDRCRFSVADLDDGLPPGPPAVLILCHRFRDPGLYPAIIDRLAVGGVLAISVLSEVGAEPGPFRAGAGELKNAFAGLQTVGVGESDGQAWLVASKGERS